MGDDERTRFDRAGAARRPPTAVDSTTTTASWYSTAVDRVCDSHRQLGATTYTPGNGNVSAAAAAAATESALPALVGGAASPAAAVQSPAVRRKRGRPPKAGGACVTKTASAGTADAVAVPAAPKRSKKEKEEEDVCFICFDGGKLVLCDRRDCPKAYHPACVRRDESFFRRRVRWNCGWHLCNICQRNALFLCYTCPYSLCKTCVKQADILSVRGNKGFCRTCMTTVSLIEGINEGSKCHVDFDDTTSWEYLFKVYWIFLKQKESLTSVELKCATNPWKGQILNHKNVYLQGLHSISADETVDSSSSAIQWTSNSSRVEVNGSKRRKTRKHSPLQICSQEVKDKLYCGDVDWASKELLEFVSHMKNGDLSTLSQFDVQALLLEYIKRNNLCDPHQKSHIVCDRRLETLFGKARVGHFEMLNLLEHHFKESSLQNGAVHAAAGDCSISGLEAEWCNEDTYAANRQKKRQWCQKDDLRGRQLNLDNYAAIDVHNINLIYLKRSLMETLIDDADKFHDRVVGSVVRVKICGDDLKQDMYRLVRVVGTSKSTEPNKIGDKTAHIMLKILNLDKIEDVTIEGISNHDFSEDECRNLRQNMKCGLVKRMTVGEVQERAIALQAIRVNDLLEADILKLNHLRDQASEMGHRKNSPRPSAAKFTCSLLSLTIITLRECIEKLELLKSPEEQQRRVHEILEVHADPKMDPSYHSDEDLEQSVTKSSNTSPNRIELFTPRNGGDTPCSEAKSSKAETPPKSHESTPSLELEKDAARILEELSRQVDPCHPTKHELETPANNASPQVASSDASVTSSSTALALSLEHNDLEKVWHYQDPSGKVQGPFCMWQLRKWHLSGYFPSDLKIWKINESWDSAVLLSEALFLHGHGSDCQLQSNNSRFGSKDANITSDSRNFEHNLHLSSNMNIDSMVDEQNKGRDSDMTYGAACNVDEKQAVTDEYNGKGEGLQCSLMSSEENQKSPQAESSLNKVEAVCQSDISSSTARQLLMVDHSPEHEGSDLPRSTVEDANEDFKYTRMKNDEFSASALCDKNPSSPSQDSSSARLELPNLQNLPSNLRDEDTKEAEAENKGKNNDTSTATEDKEPPCPLQTSAAPKQNPSADWNDPPNLQKLEFADLPKQMQVLHKKDTDSLTEDTKASTASDLPVQDSGMTSWNLISGEIELSIPVSSVVSEKKDMKGDTPMGHCVSSGHDVGVSWSASSSMVVYGPAPVSSEWVGYSHMHTKPCDELDTGLGCGPSIKFGEPSNGHETTSGWHDGLIELSTLGDESVSDLLSEVEALESMNGGIASTSRIDCGEDTIDSPSNDCFDTLVGLSPTLDHGKRDGWSSTCTVQFCSQPTPTEESHSPPRVFELNIDGCSTKTSNAGTSSPCTEDQREMKPGFECSNSQDSALVHAPPETMHSLNLVSYTSDLKHEESAKRSSTHLENLASEGLLTASLPLPTSLGLTSCSVSEGDTKLIDVSVNHDDFLPQDQTPPSISSGKSVDISNPEQKAGVSNPEQKAGVDPSYITVSTKEVVAQADLLSLQQPLSRPASPIISRLNTSSLVREEVKGTEVSQGEVSSPSSSPTSSSTSMMNLPGPKEEGEMKQTDAFVDSGELAPQAHKSPLSPPHSALSAQLPTSPTTSSMGSPGPTEEGQMKKSDASVNHEELAPDVQELPLPLPLSALPVQLPTSPSSSGMDSPGPKEEGEMKQPGPSVSHMELAPQVDELPLSRTLSVLPVQLPTSPSTSRMDLPGPKEDRRKKQPDACVKHDELAPEVHEPSPPSSLSALPAQLPASPSTSRMYLAGLGGKDQPDASVNLEEVVLPGQELSPLPLSTSRMDSPVSPPSPPSISKMDSPVSPPSPPSISKMDSPVSPPSPPATRADVPEEGELDPTTSSSYVEQPGQDPCPPESLLPLPPPLPQSRIKTSIPEEKINQPSHSANKQKNNGHKQKNNGSTSQAGRPQPSHRMSSLDSSVKSATVMVDSNFSPPGSSAKNNKSTTWGAGRGNPRVTSSGHSNPHRDPAVFYVAANHQGNNRAMQQQTRYQGVLGRPFCPKDWNYHHYPHQHPGMVPGFIKPNRQSWNRQCIPYGGSVGGGLPRQPHPGHSRQRVCKFYENGYCKKGASCTFLHPS